MGTFDWNNDGKQDSTDDFLFLEVISKDASDNNESFARRASPSQQTGCAVIVIGITIVLCIFALCMGYGSAIEGILGFFALACAVLGFFMR